MQFTVDNMLYQMCVNATWAEEYDSATSEYTEYCADGTIKSRTFETVDLPMDTVLNLVDKFTALDIINNMFDDQEIVISAMHNHDTFATRNVGGKVHVIGWNDRSK